jgi:hypothetical protein
MEPKDIYKSKTVLGVVTMLMTLLSLICGIKPESPQWQAILPIVQGVVGLAGAIWAVYGRASIPNQGLRIGRLVLQDLPRLIDVEQFCVRLKDAGGQPVNIPAGSPADEPQPIQPIPGSDKPGGFCRAGFLLALCGLGLAALVAFGLTGCASTTSAPSLPAYAPPAQCTGTFDNATGKYTGGDSEILKVLPNPTAVGVALQLGDVAAIRGGAYKAADALVVIDEIDAAVAAATDYGTLATYVSGKLADANAAAGTAVFVNSGLLAQFTSRAVISDCDRAIILRHTAAQRAVIKALAGGK